MKIRDVPERNRMRFSHFSPVVYCFDDDGEELGVFLIDNVTGLYSNEVDTSTAGRQWSDELKTKLV